ncbi:MAG: phytanoyl-CoA dioxygenase [Pelagibacteraceae bacterium]|jgi:ectoine hydroxylase-related dioxygenase (phytanoyl-CoA dioxygenase family)|nr:phytanoyl-CoA dioxygenase [Pelagibacteraceae bacterium]MBT3903029.1 phytanoyl-CoA dioxygenase [Pelagibacteraceae bacterium]MBT4951940.1 phytanoyl-CoA dioxygenase [Pelagibacteraceae bacterium]
MKKFNRENFNNSDALDELMQGSGVVVIENVYSLDKINEARLIVNHFADTQKQKESHFNAEAEATGKIKLQQRVWNLFGKGEIFSYLITEDIIFTLMSKLLGTEFFCGSYCASRLLPGSLGQELHIDYPYWDFYNAETFPMGLNSSFAQNCQVTIPLDVCSVESGATAYIPGSQKKLHYPNQKNDFSNKQQMIANPGDLVFFNGNCWHGASPNQSDNQRAALLIEFLPKYIKPVEDLITYLDEDFKKNSDDKVRQLLGLNYEYPKIMDVSKKKNNIGIGYKAK